MSSLSAAIAKLATRQSGPAIIIANAPSRSRDSRSPELSSLADACLTSLRNDSYFLCQFKLFIGSAAKAIAGLIADFDAKRKRSLTWIGSHLGCCAECCDRVINGHRA